MPVASIGIESGPVRLDPDILAPRAILDQWLQLGGRGIDLNAVHEKDVLAALMANDVKREDVFITGKVLDCSSGPTEIEKSLQGLNMGINYIDLLLVNFPHDGSCSDTW